MCEAGGGWGGGEILECGWGKRGGCGEGYEGRLGVAKQSLGGKGAENIVCRP